MTVSEVVVVNSVAFLSIAPMVTVKRRNTEIMMNVFCILSCFVLYESFVLIPFHELLDEHLLPGSGVVMHMGGIDLRMALDAETLEVGVVAVGLVAILVVHLHKGGVPLRYLHMALLARKLMANLVVQAYLVPVLWIAVDIHLRVCLGT